MRRHSQPSMPRHRLRTALSLILLAALVPQGNALATVTRVVYTIDGRGVQTFAAGERVSIWRRSPNVIRVRGTLLDLCTQVQVKRGSVIVSDPVATIVARSGGDNTYIDVKLAGSTTTPLGVCELLIRYTVETNGPDRVPLEVFDRGKFNGTELDLKGKIGDRLRIRLSGSGLSQATYRVVETPEQNTGFREESRSASAYEFSLVLQRLGTFEVNPAFIVDRSLPNAVAARAPALPPGYDNPGQGLRVESVPNPIFAEQAPSLVSVNTSVRLHGENFIAEVYSSTKNVTYTTRGEYLSQSPPTTNPSPSQRTVARSPSDLDFVVPPNYVPGSLTWIVTKHSVLKDGNVVEEEFPARAPLFYGRAITAPSVVGIPLFENLLVLREDQVPPTFPLSAEQRQRAFNSRLLRIQLQTRFTNTPATATEAAPLGIAPVGFEFGGVPLTVLQHTYDEDHNTTMLAPLRLDREMKSTFKVTNGAGSGESPLCSYVPPPSNASVVETSVSNSSGANLHVQGQNIGVCAFDVPLFTTLSFIDASGVTRRLTNAAGNCGAGSVSFTIPPTVARGPIREIQISHFGGVAAVAGSVTVTP